MTADKEARDPLVFLVAGEPSGDRLGQGLMKALRHQMPGIRFEGVGGPLMAAQGLDSLFPMDELSVMGLSEVVPRIPHLLGRIRQTAEAARSRRPGVVVTIDSPDFNFRVAKRLAGSGIPLVHYVAPTVWAWRPGRARKIARFLDGLLALFPFEPPYFEREGLKCTFVGHPVVESGLDRGDGPAFRRRHGIPDDVPVLCLLPGSRRSEIERLLPVFAHTAARLKQDLPRLRLVVPTLEYTSESVYRFLDGRLADVVVVNGDVEKADAFAASDAALAASGTVALELAAARVPAVIGYRVSAVTAWLARRLVRVKWVSLVNLVAGKTVQPEFLQDDCRPPALADALLPLLADAAASQQQRRAYETVMQKLWSGRRPPSIRAAEAVLEILHGAG